MVTSVTSPTNLANGASDRNGSSAKAGEEFKRNKWRGPLSRLPTRAEFLPAVIETPGRFGKALLAKFQEYLKKERNPRTPMPLEADSTWATPTFDSYHKTKISIALQRGNALAIYYGLSNSLKARGVKLSTAFKFPMRPSYDALFFERLPRS